MLPCYLPEMRLIYNLRMRITSRRKRRSAPVPETAAEPVKQAEASPEPQAQQASGQTDAERTTGRVGIPFNADGTIDFDSMRNATKERLRVAFKDPTLASKLGIESSAAAPGAMKIPMAFFEKAADIIHDTIGKLAVVAVVRQGYPADQAMTMLLTADDKAMLNPLAAQALDDWCPAIEGKYQSLALLGAGYISVFMTKFTALKKPADILPFPAPEQKVEREP